MREMLITTHSPYLISDSDSENVFKLKKENGILKSSKPEFNTFGASVNEITIEIFEKIDTIGDYANDAMKNYNEKLANKNFDREHLITEINKKFGDSVEKTILINRIIGTIK